MDELFYRRAIARFFIKKNHYAKITIFMHEPPIATPYLFSFFGGSTWDIAVATLRFQASVLHERLDASRLRSSLQAFCLLKGTI